MVRQRLIINEGRRNRPMRTWLRTESGLLRVAGVLAATLILLATSSFAVVQFGLRVDIISLSVVFLALEFGTMSGLTLCVLLGYLGDVFAGQPKGLWITGAVWSFFLLRLLMTSVVEATFSTVVVLGIIATSFSWFIRVLVLVLLGPSGLPKGVWWPLMGTIFSSALLAYPVYLFIHFCSDRFRGRDESMFGS